MSLSKIAYKALEDVVGSENISSDPAIMQAYSKQPWPHGALGKTRPDAVVLPGSKEDVQAIIRLANRYKFIFIPAGSYNWDVPVQTKTVIVDTKRMDKILEIDERNMYAVVEPGVTHAQLSTEVMKKGLINNSTFGGGPSSVVANKLFQGIAGLGYRLGIDRETLAMEWILPTGEILNTGSSGIAEAGYFFPEGPGPDFRGLSRGFMGLIGGFGIVTKMAIKLLPWPGPRDLPYTGISINKEVRLPQERFKFHLIRYTDPLKMIDALYEMGRAEIGAVVQRYPAQSFLFKATKSKEEFWKEWDSGYFQKEAKNVIVVWLVGFSSKRQLEYEERVLQKIINKTEGEDVAETDKLYRTTIPWACEWFRCGVSGRLMRPTSKVTLAMWSSDSMDNSLKVIEIVDEVKKEWEAPFIGIEESDWICPYDYGWFSNAEGAVLIVDELKTEEDVKKVAELTILGVKAAIENKFYHTLQVAPINLILGPVYGNYHLLLQKIKKAIDPENISNPPNPIAVEETHNK